MPGVGAGGCCDDHSLGPKITIATISCKLDCTWWHSPVEMARLKWAGGDRLAGMGQYHKSAVYKRACLPDAAGFARQGGRGETGRRVGQLQVQTCLANLLFSQLPSC